MPALNASAITRRLRRAGVSPRVESYTLDAYPGKVWVHAPTTSTTVPQTTVWHLDRAETVLRGAGFTVARIAPESLVVTLEA